MAHAARALGPRRDARLHGRVGARDRRRLRRRAALRPRRPRRQPPARRTTPGRVSPRRRRSDAIGCAGSGGRLIERARLPDPRRGLLGRPALRQDRPRRHRATAATTVVAILDSERAGETQDGSRSSARSTTRSASARRMRSSASRPRAVAFRPPGASCSRAASRKGLHVENGPARVPRRRPRADRARAPARRRAARPAPAARRPERADRREPRAPGARIVHTVGSDCAIGKMTCRSSSTARRARAASRSVFVPTGQTGIAIAGWGIAVDAVVADFLAGAARAARRRGRARGATLLWVEGQGASATRPTRGVTLGLLHGCAPHALVLCHRPGTTEIEGYPGPPAPAAPGARGDLTRRCPLPARRARVACDRAQHRRPRRGRGARRRSPASKPRPGSPRTIRSASAPARLLDAVLASLR